MINIPIPPPPPLGIHMCIPRASDAFILPTYGVGNLNSVLDFVLSILMIERGFINQLGLVLIIFKEKVYFFVTTKQGTTKTFFLYVRLVFRLE